MIANTRKRGKATKRNDRPQAVESMFTVIRGADGYYLTFDGEPGKPVYRVSDVTTDGTPDRLQGEYTDRDTAEQMAETLNRRSEGGESRVTVTGPHAKSIVLTQLAPVIADVGRDADRMALAKLRAWKR